MFEKKAEEWVKENMDCCKTDNSVNQPIPYFDEEERCCAKSAFQDGAEFGYNEGCKDCAKARLNVTTISDCPIKDEEESKCKTAYIKGIRTMANALKDYDRTEGAWTDYFEHKVDEVLKRLLKEIE